MKLRLTILKSIIITAIVLVCCTPVLSFIGADSSPFSIHVSALEPTGKCGENATYTFDESTGLLTITGTGEIDCLIEDFKILGIPVYSYMFNDNKNINKVIIADGITNIPDYAFRNCSNLSEIIIPDTVTKIEKYAFFNTSLVQITIPEHLTYINPNAFSNCNTLQKITVDENNNTYFSDNNGVLYNKSKTELILFPLGSALKTYVFPDTVKTISCSFSDCNSLTKIVFNNTIKKIPSSTFSSCVNLQEVILGKAVESVSSSAFRDCIKLKTINIPISIKSFATTVFDGCTALSELTIYNSSCSFDPDSIPKNTKIYAPKDSKAEAYAEKYGNEFSAITKCSSHSFGSWSTKSSATCSAFGYKTRTCTKCRYLESDILSILDHQFGSWSITIVATCTTDGIKSRSCSNCGFEEAQTLPAKNHDYSTNWTIDQNATCTTTGSKSHHCKNCDAKSNITTIPVTDHTYGNWEIVKEETCTTNGTKQKKCINCTSIIQENITALGHIYSSSWTIDQKSTCIKTGSKSHHCINCDAKKDVTKVAKSAHSYKKQVTKATLSNNGKQISVCTVCNYTTTKNISKIASVKLSKTTYTYDGKVKTPSVIVKDSDGTPLKKDTHYVVTYPNGRKVVGTYSVNITFKGNYSGNKTLKFTIKLGTVTNLQQISNKKGVSITWNSVRGATGYEVYIFDAKTNSYKLLKAFSDNIAQNPKAKGKLTVKVRAYYKNISGKIYYGDFSGVKTFTAIK